MLLHPSRWEKRFNYRLQNPWCHNYNFLNTCFNCFSYFLLQDGTKGLTARSKIHIYHNCNYFLNTSFVYYSYFLLQYRTKEITAGSKIHLFHNYNFINTYFDYFSYFLLQDDIMGLNKDSKIQVCHNYNKILNTCFDYFSYFLLQDGTKGLTTLSKIHVYHSFIIYSFSILCDDRSKASSKTILPHSAIQSLLLQMRISSPVLKVIMKIL